MSISLFFYILFQVKNNYLFIIYLPIYLSKIVKGSWQRRLSNASALKPLWCAVRCRVCYFSDKGWFVCFSQDAQIKQWFLMDILPVCNPYFLSLKGLWANDIKLRTHRCHNPSTNRKCCAAACPWFAGWDISSTRWYLFSSIVVVTKVISDAPLPLLQCDLALTMLVPRVHQWWRFSVVRVWSYL